MIAPSRAPLARGCAVAAVLGWASIGAPALSQGLSQAHDVDIPWWRLASVLALCLLLAVSAIYALRVRMTGGANLLKPSAWKLDFAKSLRLLGGDAKRLKLVETLRLSHQVDICLIRCDGKEFIVAATPHGGFVVSAGGEVASDAADPQ